MKSLKYPKSLKRIAPLMNESPELASYHGNMVTKFKSTLISRKQLGLGGDTKVIDVTCRLKYTKTDCW